MNLAASTGGFFRLGIRWGASSGSIGRVDLPPNFHPVAIRAFAVLDRAPFLDHPRVEFSTFFQGDGLAASPGLGNEIMGLFPIAPSRSGAPRCRPCAELPTFPALLHATGIARTSFGREAG
ncbi:MAG: hypothetical protein RQ752_03280 [Thermohalobaculum sp.]|nr:hypothetical protein [Thermohalobaculum sp.]